MRATQWFCACLLGLFGSTSVVFAADCNALKQLKLADTTIATAERVTSGSLEGPGTIAVNAGLSKVMQVHEGVRLRFEATFTNVLNHTNFAPPATNVSNPSTFGILQSAQTAEYGGNRTGQVALRLEF